MFVRCFTKIVHAGSCLSLLFAPSASGRWQKYKRLLSFFRRKNRPQQKVKKRTGQKVFRWGPLHNHNADNQAKSREPSCALC